MSFCAAYGCSNRTSRLSSKQKAKPKVSFHRFPKDEQRRKLWLQACERDSWIPSVRSVLCSDHFTSDCFDRASQSLRRLKPKAVPTVFSAFPTCLQKMSTGELQPSTSAANTEESQETSSKMESHGISAFPDKLDTVMKISNNGVHSYCELDKVEIEEETGMQNKETFPCSEAVMNINYVSTCSNNEMGAKVEIKAEALNLDKDLQNEEHLPCSNVITNVNNAVMYSNSEIGTKIEIKEEPLDSNIGLQNKETFSSIDAVMKINTAVYSHCKKDTKAEIKDKVTDSSIGSQNEQHLPL